MNFRKIIIINPPNPTGFVSNKDSMGGFGQLYPLGAPPFPPMDMVYLASFLTEKNLSIDVLECNGLGLTRKHLKEKTDRISNSAGEEQNLVLIRTSAPTLDWDLSICQEIKKNAQGIKIGIFGPIVAQVPWRVKKENSIDYIIKGEPDETVYDLITAKSEEEILGLTYRYGRGWIENSDRALTKDIDSLPLPKWEMFPYKKYRLPKSSTTSDVSFLPMLTSRGCPFGCSYCTYPLGQGVPWRFRSPQNVVDEIEYLVDKLGIQYIIFRDPIFSLNQKRVIEICEQIKRRNLTFKWKCETRIDCLNEETLRAMARAGCEGINIGIESSEVEVQANVGRKPIPKEDVIKIVRFCRQLKIKTFCFFIIGLPGDTAQTILETIAFAIDLRPNWVQFTAAAPLIGTKLRE
ncbi:MAG: radical SAM protein [Planctomycetes bacterium]|nr:radical SAM protein [Planctomycetota bacterium]